LAEYSGIQIEKDRFTEAITESVVKMSASNYFYGLRSICTFKTAKAKWT